MSAPGKPLVFLIDDEAMSNSFNAMLIQRTHPEVEIKAFTNAIDALLDLKNPETKMPEMIFLDLYMPDMDGWGFMDVFKTLGLDIEVVVLTSSNESTDKAKAQGNDQIKDYVNKPMTLKSITGILKKFFQNADHLNGSGPKYPFI